MEDKCEKKVFFRTVEQRTPNLFGVLSIMPCATAVNDFLGVRPLVSHVRPNVRPCGHEIFSCPYFLVLIFNATTISCPMLQPLSCLTIFCDHNFSLVCRFNLQFSQTYINIDTDEIQHWFYYFVQSLWNKNTIYERSNGRTVHHICIPYTNTFFLLIHIVLFTIM